MKKVLLLGVVLALGATARADLQFESPNFWGSMRVDAVTGVVSPEAGTRAIYDVYNNTSSSANAAFSSTDLTSVWGDNVVTVGTGLLKENAFTVYNSSSSAGPLLTAQVAIDFYRNSDSSYIGGYTTNPISFGGGAGLAAGFYTIINVTGLDSLNIVLDTTDLIVTQTVLNPTGTASRLGWASLNPVTIGSSPISFYADSATVGAAGFYNLSGGTPANLGYRIAVPEPTTLALLALGGVLALRRR